MVKVHMILTMILDTQPDLDIPLDPHLVSQVLKKIIKSRIFCNFFQITGSRPESSDGDQSQYQNGNPPLLLDPMAISMMPPEYERPPSAKKNSVIEKMANGLSKLHLSNTFGPKGSLV